MATDATPQVSDTGPLAGIAVGIKDIIDTAHLPTQMGSSIYAGWQPRADAPIVARLKRLGAVPLAKTTTTAFAFVDPTETRNPRAPGRTPVDRPLVRQRRWPPGCCRWHWEHRPAAR